MFGAIQVLLSEDGGRGCAFSGKKHFEGVRFNVISVTSGWVGVQFLGKKRYVRLEWPLYVDHCESRWRIRFVNFSCL